MDPELLKKQRERRKLNGNKTTRKYEKTPKGFLMRVYRNMKSRVTGIQKKKAHLYLGKDLLDKHDFYQWSLTNDSFLLLYKNWVNSNFNRKICPSIDRIKSELGYTLDNIQWITHSENSSKGAKSKYFKTHEK